MTYVLDSNVIIHYLRAIENVVRCYRNAVSEGYRLLIPRAVDYEICRGLTLLEAVKKTATYNDMTKPSPIGQCEIVDMGEGIWDIAKQIYVDLRRKGFTVGEVDIFIGAFCLLHNYTLVTANTKDFKNIAGLKLKNWWED